MLTPTLQHIKKELETLPQKELLRLCTDLAKFSKTNKELLGFLLFDADDIPGYIHSINEELDRQFELVPHAPYLAKKAIRKISQNLAKYHRYAKNKQVEIETLIHFCNNMDALQMDFNRYAVIENLYNTQIRKIRKAMETLHPDLQHEYEEFLKNLDGLL